MCLAIDPPSKFLHETETSLKKGYGNLLHVQHSHIAIEFRRKYYEHSFSALLADLVVLSTIHCPPELEIDRNLPDLQT